MNALNNMNQSFPPYFREKQLKPSSMMIFSDGPDETLTAK